VLRTVKSYLNPQDEYCHYRDSNPVTLHFIHMRYCLANLLCVLLVEGERHTWQVIAVCTEVGAGELQVH
jgi:hypothetical protein